ncbi:hypothetical protein IPG41_03435 [Candidatus Peregrinibacteria bacterium]|nr:MAG: hypothetical protein IPG41_03435 [Candidatus Peregrinibacteria bacterium]
MYIGLDLETTGLNPKNDHIIEVAILLFDDNKILEEWSSLVRPPIPIPPFTTHLTGIDDEMVKDAPTLQEILPLIKEKIGDLPIMGHFIFFDVNFLNEKGAGLPNVQLDSCQLAQVFMYKEASYSLEVLTQKLGIEQPNAHRAIHDVRANIELMWKLCGHLRALPKEDKTLLRPILEKSQWTWAATLLQVLDEKQQKSDELLPSGGGEFSPVSEKHTHLKSIVAEIQPPFLCEEGSHTTQDLIDYALEQNEESLLVLAHVQNLPAHPDLGVLKHPNQYLDEERLEQFVQRTPLDTGSSMLALKVSLWAKYTKKGEKSEIRLVKDEASLWYDICCQEESAEKSFYKKATETAFSKKVRVVSHLHFLKDRSRKDPALPLPPNVIVAQSEELVRTLEQAWHIRLSESRFLSELSRLQKENPAHKEIIDSLAARVSILFGFCGMFLQKYGLPGDARHPLVVEAWHQNSSEWNKIKMSAEAIEAATAALGDDLQNGPSLDEFTRYLTYLTKILRTASPILWMTWSADEEPIIHSFPEHPSTLFTERVWKGIEKLHLFCHHADLKDDFEFIKKELGLPETLQHLKAKESLPLPIEYPKTQMSKPNDVAYVSDVAHELTEQLLPLQGNAFVLVNAQTASEQLFYKLNDFAKKNGKKLFVQFMSGGLGKIVKMAENSNGKNIFVGNEDLFDMLLNEGVDLRFLALYRLPFSSPSDPIQLGRAKAYVDAYKGYTLPHAALRFRAILNEFLANQWEGKRILILDPRIRDYEKVFI